VLLAERWSITCKSAYCIGFPSLQIFTFISHPTANDDIPVTDGTHCDISICARVPVANTLTDLTMISARTACRIEMYQRSIRKRLVGNYLEVFD
jgi:hypothetical protein